MTAALLLLGSCYRAEVDLSLLLDASVTSGAPSGAGALSSSGAAGEGAYGSGGSATAGSSAGGDVALEGGADLGGQGGNGGGAEQVGGQAGDGWTTINAGGACHDPPFNADDEACRISGVKPGNVSCMPPDLSQNAWNGCYNGGCSVCVVHGELPGYPYYFDWHPCCQKNSTCSNHPYFVCNELCPEPTEHDKVAPCGKRGRDPG